MLTIHIRLRVAGVRACVYFIIRWICMTVRTIVPLSVMVTGINREILPVVVKGSWRPGCLCMTICTCYRKLSCCMRWIICLGIIGRMAIITQFWQSCIASLVTGCTIIGNGQVCSGKVRMGWICSWLPPRIRSMAVGTFSGYSGSSMVRIKCLIIIVGMATCTRVGGSGIS